MGWLGSPRRRWYLLAVAWVVLIVLGIGGFLQQSQASNLNRSALDNLYLTLQLATLDYDGSAGEMNWRLQVARFAAPILAAGTILQAASVVFLDEFNRWRLRFLSGHVVVCGLGAAGSRLAIALSEAGHRVVGVEPDPGERGLATVKDHGIPTLVGDPTDPGVLRTVRVDRAVRLVALCRTDAVNVAVAAAGRAVPRHAGRPALMCSVHLDDADLSALLQGEDLGGTAPVRVEFFTLHERAGRALLAERPPFGDGSRPPHLVVLGLGQLGGSVVVAAAQQWAEQGRGPLPLTLVDREARGRFQALLLGNPALEAAVDAVCLDLDLDAPAKTEADEFRRILADRPPTLVAVAFDNESLALSSALAVHRELRDPTVPVVVRTDADTGMGQIVAPIDGVAPFPGMVLFPFLDRACSPALIEGGVREQLARAVHEDFTAHSGIAGGLHRRWDDLSDEERDSSRRAADAVIDGLAGLGYELVPLRRWGIDGIALAPDEVEQLAAAEHERWRAERTADGWTYGAVRDDAARHNPLLVPWTDLPEDAKAGNRATIAAMPAMLARAGFEAVPVQHRDG